MRELSIQYETYDEIRLELKTLSEQTNVAEVARKLAVNWSALRQFLTVPRTRSLRVNEK